MTKEDMLYLSGLSRIELTEAEIDRFTKEFGDILEYVARVRGLAEGVSAEPKMGIVHNVFREDKDPHESGIYTEDLLNAAPMRERGYVKVKKILEG